MAPHRLRQGGRVRRESVWVGVALGVEQGCRARTVAPRDVLSRAHQLRARGSPVQQQCFHHPARRVAEEGLGHLDELAEARPDQHLVRQQLRMAGAGRGKGREGE